MSSSLHTTPPAVADAARDSRPLLEEALTAVERNDLAQATAFWQQAHLLAPHSALVSSVGGYVKFLDGEVPEAISLYETALAIRPDAVLRQRVALITDAAARGAIQDVRIDQAEELARLRESIANEPFRSYTTPTIEPKPEALPPQPPRRNWLPLVAALWAVVVFIGAFLVFWSIKGSQPQADTAVPLATPTPIGDDEIFVPNASPQPSPTPGQPAGILTPAPRPVPGRPAAPNRRPVPARPASPNLNDFPAPLGPAPTPTPQSGTRPVPTATPLRPQVAVEDRPMPTPTPQPARNSTDDDTDIGPRFSNP